MKKDSTSHPLEHTLNAVHKKVCDLESAVDDCTAKACGTSGFVDELREKILVLSGQIHNQTENEKGAYNLLAQLVNSLAHLATEMDSMKATMADMSNAMLVVAGKPSEAAPKPPEPWLLKSYVFDSANPPVPDAAEYALLNQGKKIDAIKLYRARIGCGLKEAKDVMDANWTPAMNAAYQKLSASFTGSYGKVTFPTHIYHNDHAPGNSLADNCAGTVPPFDINNPPSFNSNELGWMNNGDPIKAMKLYRNRIGCGLMEAKNVVVAYMDQKKALAAAELAEKTKAAANAAKTPKANVWGEAAVDFTPPVYTPEGFVILPLNEVEIANIHSGNLGYVDAIKLYRKRLGCDLKTAKFVVDSYINLEAKKGPPELNKEEKAMLPQFDTGGECKDNATDHYHKRTGLTWSKSFAIVNAYVKANHLLLTPLNAEEKGWIASGKANLAADAYVSRLGCGYFEANTAILAHKTDSHLNSKEKTWVAEGKLDHAASEYANRTGVDYYDAEEQVIAHQKQMAHKFGSTKE